MSFPFRTELVAGNVIFGTQEAVWKERLRGKSVLGANIMTVAFTTAEVRDCFALEFIFYLPKGK
jgi:hypothetical protein